MSFETYSHLPMTAFSRPDVLARNLATSSGSLPSMPCSDTLLWGQTVTAKADVTQRRR